MQDCVLSVRKRIQQIESLCKEKHAYLRSACAHTLATIQGTGVEDEQLAANALFFPLKIATDSNETSTIVPVALKGITQLVVAGLVNATVRYDPPNVTVPAAKKGFFAVVDVTAPKAEEDGGSLPKSRPGVSSLTEVMLDTVMPHTSSASDEIRAVAAQTLVAAVSSSQSSITGKQLLRCFAASIQAAVDSKVSLQVIEGDLSLSLSAQESEEVSPLLRSSSAAQIVKVVLDRLGSAPAAQFRSLEATVAVLPPIDEQAEPRRSATSMNEDGEAEESASAQSNPECTQQAQVDGEEVARGEEGGDAEQNNDTSRSDVDLEGSATHSQENGTELADKRSSTVTSNLGTSEAGEGSSQADVAGKRDSASATSLSPTEADCLAVLGLLCRLSVAEVPSLYETPELRSRAISTTLLCTYVEHVGSALASHPSFQAAVHTMLCPSLLHNCCSTSPFLYLPALRLLKVLTVQFRSIMKSKTAVFYMKILFPLLESTSTVYAQKVAILSIFEGVSTHPQTLVDWFLNFDCAPGYPNLYDEFVKRLLKRAQTTQSLSSTSNASSTVSKQESALRFQALSSLRNLVHAEFIFATNDPRELRASTEGTVGSDALQSGAAEGAGVASPASTNAYASDHPRSPLRNPQSPTASSNGKGSLNEDSLILTDADVDRLVRSKKAYDAVTEVFNRKRAKDGIKMGLSMGIVESRDPTHIAKFLLSKDLDRVKVGEYLSGNDPDTKAVLKAFIELNDFTGLTIDEAMRSFLGKFKINGEAQTVDRTMELFAQRYCEQNPTVFSNPGPAYVLAFSIMMLNTDAHSVHIKNKMTLQEFIRNNAGIDDGKDFPVEFIEGIYNRIAKNEIVLEDADASSEPQTSSAKPNGGGAVNGDRKALSKEKRLLLSQQTEISSLVKKSSNLIALDISDEPYSAATSREIVAAMWDGSWTAFLPAFSIPMEESDDMEVVDACLEGFEYGIRLSSRFTCRTERKAFLSALLAFTHLTSFRQIEYKNVKSIDTLMRIAAEEGNYLESSWEEVIRCISLLDKLNIIVTAPLRTSSIPHPRSNSAQPAATTQFSPDQQQHGTPTRQASSGAMQSPRAHGAAGSNHSNQHSVGAKTAKGGSASPHPRASVESPPMARSTTTGALATSSSAASARRVEFKKIEMKNAETISAYIDEVRIHRLFSHSSGLTDTAIVDLIEALCTVSAEELVQQPPRLFSLQKLIEVTESNIGRLRYVWSKMWVHISRHFVSVGVRSNQLVSMFLIDNLRQLAMKFLKRPELGSLNFQRDTLKPFEIIAVRTQLPTLRELIIASLQQMVEAEASRIRGGWPTLLKTVAICSKDPNVAVMKSVVRLLCNITTTKLDLLHSHESINALISAWNEVGRAALANKNTFLATTAIWYLRLLSVVLSSNGSALDRGPLATMCRGTIGRELSVDSVSGAATSTSRESAAGLTVVESEDGQGSWRADLDREDTTGTPAASSPDWYARLVSNIDFGKKGCDDVQAFVSDVEQYQQRTSRGSDQRTTSAEVERYRFSLWISVFASWSALCASSAATDASIGVLSVDALITTFHKQVAHFSEGNRGMVFNGIIIPLLTALQSNATISLARQTMDHYVAVLVASMDNLIDLFEAHFMHLRQFFPTLLDFMAALCASKRAAVSLTGYESLEKLLRRLDAHTTLDASDWEQVAKTLVGLRDQDSGTMKRYWERPASDLLDGLPSYAAMSLSRLLHVMQEVLRLESITEDVRQTVVQTYTTILGLVSRVLLGSRIALFVSLTPAGEPCRSLVVVLKLLRATCEAIVAMPQTRDSELHVAFIKAIIGQYIVAAEKGNSIGNQEAACLRCSVIGFLEQLASAEATQATEAFTACLPELCDLIRSTDGEVSLVLSQVFKKFMSRSTA